MLSENIWNSMQSFVAPVNPNIFDSSLLTDVNLSLGKVGKLWDSTFFKLI